MRAWGDQHKSQEHEGSDETLSIIALLVEANDHFAATKRFFSVLQHCYEALLGTLREDVTGDLNEESLSNQQCVPLDTHADECHVKAEV